MEKYGNKQGGQESMCSHKVRVRVRVREKAVSETRSDKEQRMDVVSKMKHKSGMENMRALFNRHRLYIRFDSSQYLRDESHSCCDIGRDKCSRPHYDIEAVFN
jgi:hypothetical protein